MKNDKGEMVPMRVQNGWHMCIDFHKLNEVTKKDHFPIPFLDQMAEWLHGLPGSHYFVFWMVFQVFTEFLLLKRTKKKPL